VILTSARRRLLGPKTWNVSPWSIAFITCPSVQAICEVLPTLLTLTSVIALAPCRRAMPVILKSVMCALHPLLGQPVVGPRRTVLPWLPYCGSLPNWAYPDLKPTPQLAEVKSIAS